MNENKATFFWLLALVLAFAAGGFLMHTWDKAHMPLAAADALPESAALLTLEEPESLPALPKDAQSVAAPLEISTEELPSQLIKINLPNLAQVNRPGEAEEGKETVPVSARATMAAPVILTDAQNSVTPQAAARVTVVPDEEGNTTMIQIPAEVQLITNLEQYKAFKRTARGKYPDVNFATHRMAVLKTEGSFPDSVLEVTDVADVDGNVQISYRVNVFGMDQKTNTHAYAIVRKTQKPVVLKQVL